MGLVLGVEIKFFSRNQLLMEPKSTARVRSICEQKRKQAPLPPPSFLSPPSQVTPTRRE